jgi:hypothetical protein
LLLIILHGEQLGLESSLVIVRELVPLWALRSPSCQSIELWMASSDQRISSETQRLSSDNSSQLVITIIPHST